MLAGMAGFEPAHNGVKVRCLTAWLHPIAIFYDAKKRKFIYIYFKKRREF